MTKHTRITIANEFVEGGGNAFDGAGYRQWLEQQLAQARNQLESLHGINPDAVADLLEAFDLAHAFLDSLPEGWLGKTTGDVGALNDFYLKSREIRAAIAKATPQAEATDPERNRQ